MMDEVSLHNRINVLQSELLKFHEKLSPVKSQEPGSNGLPFHDPNGKFMTICIEIAFGLLKICVCLLGPAAFPAIIFCIEGSSQLFWQVTVTCSAITLILALMTVTILYANVKRLKHQIQDTFASLLKSLNEVNFFQSASNYINGDSLKKEHAIMYFLILIFVCISTTYLSYSKNLATVFYGSLMSTGFVCGILTSSIYNRLNTPDAHELPTYNPRKVELRVTAPSPELQSSKRISRMELAGTRPVLAVLPYTTSQAYQNMKRVRTLQVPFDFRNLLRRLSF